MPPITITAPSNRHPAPQNPITVPQNQSLHPKIPSLHPQVPTVAPSSPLWPPSAPPRPQIPPIASSPRAPQNPLLHPQSPPAQPHILTIAPPAPRGCAPQHSGSIGPGGVVPVPSGRSAPHIPTGVLVAPPRHHACPSHVLQGSPPPKTATADVRALKIDFQMSSFINAGLKLAPLPGGQAGRGGRARWGGS